AVADPVGLAHKDVNPTDKTRDWSLQRKPEYQRDQTKRNNGRVPVLKEDGQYKERHRQRHNQPRDAFQVELIDRVFNPPDEINVEETKSYERNDEDGESEDELENNWISSDENRKARLEQLVNSAQRDQQRHVRANQ